MASDERSEAAMRELDALAEYANAEGLHDLRNFIRGWAHASGYHLTGCVGGARMVEEGADLGD